MSLGILVGRFGEFLEAQAPEAQASAAAPAPFPADLAHIRDAFGHHIVALSLLSRADGESVAAEQAVILEHCLAMAAKHGMTVRDAEKTALADYVYACHPTRMQLDPAIARLADDSKDDIVALIGAARALVDADGVRRPREVQFLAELSGDLSEL